MCADSCIKLNFVLPCVIKTRVVSGCKICSSFNPELSYCSSMLVFALVLQRHTVEYGRCTSKN
uniref:Uncharacterized protein n=1 Tax=Arundo donax TaxID=35708 RepID=A0A0A8YSE8_ARUDO